MLAGKQFWDSNLWIYLFTASVNPVDVAKQSRLLSLLSSAPDISISAQVVNEVANVLMQKFKYDEARIELILDHITKSSFFQPLTLAITQKALALKQRYALSWFDSLIVAAAIETGCETLLTEDMQDGLVVDGTLTIVNPFRSS